MKRIFKLIDIKCIVLSLDKFPGFLLYKAWLFILICMVSQMSLAHEQSLVASNVKSKPDLMLLKVYQPGLEVSGWVMSEKLDGVRAYWDGKNLMSRQGNVFHAPDWFKAGFPPFELDGELWLGRNQFAETVSIVRQNSPDDRWKDITYQIFEVPNQSGDLIERLEVVKEFIQKHSIKYIKVIPQTFIQGSDDVQFELARVLKANGEGLVIRNPRLSYQTGRLNSALKVKRKQDAECKVIGYLDGKGKYQGKVGSIICELLPEQVSRLFVALRDSNKTIIKIGTGLTDIQRANPPKLGAIVTFQYMGLTKNGLPRFPVFLREKVDEVN